MDNSGEEGYPENDADRPIESAGANGDGAPDNKSDPGRRVMAPAGHQGAGEDRHAGEIDHDESVEDDISDAEEYQSLENAPGAQELMGAAVDLKGDNSPGAGCRESSPHSHSDREHVNEITDHETPQGDIFVDAQSAQKDTDSGADATDLVPPPVLTPSGSKDSDLIHDSLNTSNSTLESVSMDSSFQSGNSQVLRGDGQASDPFSPRDDGSGLGGNEGTAVEEDNRGEDVDVDMKDPHNNDDPQLISSPSFNFRRDDANVDEEDGGMPYSHQQLPVSGQLSESLEKIVVEIESDPQPQPPLTSDTGVTVTQSAQSVYSHDSLDEPASGNVVLISANSASGEDDSDVHAYQSDGVENPSVRDGEGTQSPGGDGNDEDGFCGNHPFVFDQRYPEFPFNYNNYKVCCNVEPGVKKCLILETGEQIYCRKHAPAEKAQLEDEDSESSGEESAAETETLVGEGETPIPKPGFKIVNKNKDGAMKFGNLRLGCKKSGTEDNSDVESIGNVSVGSQTRDDRGNLSAAGSPRETTAAYTCSPRSPIESATKREVITVNVNSCRPVSNSFSPKEAHVHVNRTNNHTPNSVSESSQTRRDPQRSPKATSNQRSPPTVSERSSTRETISVHDLTDLGSVQDIYETESDLRPRLEGGYEEDSSYSRLLPEASEARYQSDYADATLDKLRNTQRSSPVTSPRNRSLNDFAQGEKIDMSALYRAERWLDNRNAAPSPRRQNLSTSVLSTGSGPIPGFRTLQEQQASWMKMFKLLEDQHQSDLVTQYKQHQRNIQHLQEQIEDDLCRQQDSFQKKLDVHRELMLQNSSYAGSYMPAEFLPEGSEAAEESLQTEHRMRTLPRPFIRDDDKVISGSPSLVDDSRIDEFVSSSREKGLSTRRSLEDSFEDGIPQSLSTARSGVRADLSVSSRLREGRVFSTPVQLSTSARHFSPVQVTDKAPSSAMRITHNDRDIEGVPSVNIPHHSSLLHDASLRSQTESFVTNSHLRQLSPPAGEGNTSSNARVSLREKHSKHLSDLRSYYEQELAELRAALTAPEFIMSQSPYRQVMEENLELQGRLEGQDEDISSLRRTSREQESKIQTLQARLDDTLEKYEESHVTISTLRHHLDEVRALCTEREMLIKKLEADNSRLSSALKDSYKINDQQIAEAKKEETAMQRLTERHENLHRENESNKEALNQMDSKLYDSRMEIVQLKRMISKLELENNRINRENNNLRHKGLISSLGLNTFYPMSPGESGLGTSASGQSPSHLTESHPVPGLKTPDVSNILTDDPNDEVLSNGSHDIYESPPRGSPRSPPPPRDPPRSPLVKAEEDLKRLRRTVKENLGQSLAQQRALPRNSRGSGRINGVEQGGGNSRDRSPLSSSNRSTRSSPKERFSPSHLRNGATVVQQVEGGHTTIIDTLMSRGTPQRKSFLNDVDKHIPSGGTPTRFDIDIRPAMCSRTPNSSKKRQPSTKKDKSDIKSQQSNRGREVDMAVQATLDKMKAGEFVTRPSWENSDTTTVRSSAKTQPRPKVREEKLQERVRNIRDLEVKYDDLQVEKRQLESALSKVPLHGKVNHHNRKEKEDLDNQLDKVERELGSVRMSLKRYHVLKTSGH